MKIKIKLIGVDSNGRLELTVCKYDIGDSQEALAEADLRDHLVHNMLFRLHTGSDHGDDCSNQDTQES